MKVGTKATDGTETFFWGFGQIHGEGGFVENTCTANVILSPNVRHHVLHKHLNPGFSLPTKNFLKWPLETRFVLRSYMISNVM